MKEIEMLAMHDIEGNVIPFRLRLTTEDESLLVVNIDGILYTDKDIAYKVIKYKCECIIQNRKRIVDIFYYYNRMKWYLEIKSVPNKT